MNQINLNLFPSYVKIIDFDPAPQLNKSILDFAKKRPEFNDSTSNCNILEENCELSKELQLKFNEGLSAYLKDIYPERSNRFEVDAYMFLNYTEKSSFTPYHNHVGDGDLVAIYYASTHQYEKENLLGSYYMLDKGLLILHDPRCDTIDRRFAESQDHYKIYPKENRMIIQPATISHSVTPSDGGTRLAVTCNFIINKSERLANYKTYNLEI